MFSNLTEILLFSLLIGLIGFLNYGAFLKVKRSNKLRLDHLESSLQLEKKKLEKSTNKHQKEQVFQKLIGIQLDLLKLEEDFSNLPQLIKHL